ncbi:hypothetical protein RHMOL_Rhmol12G0192100 [Rhododendron molle]|uniref:Uncharacterized protein n=1 Tax=Rhododendron molle TaxID=49168 RepID=A0ACC0LLG5_RHOML|nr:hypothetical protein RHMOL_Rhmol12G0192100 [Rhododendron molle]
MGNCQAIDNASLVIQQPCGRADKLYSPVSANEVMKMNPGHYVAQLLTTTTTATSAAAAGNNQENRNIVRITRIKLLRSTDTLTLGHVYRLITTQEVMKGLWEKRCAKMKKRESESESGDKQMGGMKEKLGSEFERPPRRSEKEKTNQVSKHDRHRPRPTPSSANAAKSKTWQPSLRSISEATS